MLKCIGTEYIQAKKLDIFAKPAFKYIAARTNRKEEEF